LRGCEGAVWGCNSMLKAQHSFKHSSAVLAVESNKLHKHSCILHCHCCFELLRLDPAPHSLNAYIHKHTHIHTHACTNTHTNTHARVHAGLMLLNVPAYLHEQLMLSAQDVPLEAYPEGMPPAVPLPDSLVGLCSGCCLNYGFKQHLICVRAGSCEGSVPSDLVRDAVRKGRRRPAPAGRGTVRTPRPAPPP